MKIGTVEALITTYESVSSHFAATLGAMDFAVAEKIICPEAKGFRSIYEVALHVCEAAWLYAEILGFKGEGRNRELLVTPGGLQDLIKCLEEAVNETAMLVWRYRGCTDKQLSQITFSSGGSTYDLEQMLEHAIVHVMRHEQQIARYLGAISNSRGD